VIAAQIRWPFQRTDKRGQVSRKLRDLIPVPARIIGTRVTSHDRSLLSRSQPMSLVICPARPLMVSRAGALASPLVAPGESPVEIRYPRSNPEEQGEREQWPWPPAAHGEKPWPERFSIPKNHGSNEGTPPGHRRDALLRLRPYGRRHGSAAGCPRPGYRSGKTGDSDGWAHGFRPTPA
jgi:hypothetical protein